MHGESMKNQSQIEVGSCTGIQQLLSEELGLCPEPETQ